MPKFIITWDMSGETEIEAESKDAALAEFATWGDDEVMATNDHYNVQAETVEEIKASRQRTRYGDHASKVRDVYMEQLRQDMAEEQRHG